MLTVWHAARIVFAHWKYVVGALVGSLTVLVAILLASHQTLLVSYYQLPSTGVVDEIQLILRLLLAAPIAIGWFAFSGVVLLCLWIGMTAALAVYTVRHTANFRWRAFGQLGLGSVSALIGLGCVACGPLLLGGLLSLLGATGVILLLPWHGTELLIIAVPLLWYATYSTARVLQAPPTCAV